MRTPSGPTDPATQTSKLLAASRASRTPSRLISRTLSAKLCRRQAEGVGAEGIGFNDLGAGLEVFVMNAADQVGLRKIQFVVTSG